MKVNLDAEKIRFRREDGSLPVARQLEIAAGRIAGCQRVLRPGESPGGLEAILALRGSGIPDGIQNTCTHLLVQVA